MYRFLIIILKKMVVHVQFCNTDSCRNNVVIVGIRVYNKGPDHIQKLDQNKSSNRELRSFLLRCEYCSVD